MDKHQPEDPTAICPRCHLRYYKQYGHTWDECEAKVNKAVDDAWERNR